MYRPLLFSFAMVVGAGCFSPGLSDSQLTCESGLCPPGLFCIEGVCTQMGISPIDAQPVTPDASGNAADASPDAPLPIVEILSNVNGPEVEGVDFLGEWASDPGSGGICNGSEGGSSNNPVQGTVDDALFGGVMFGDPVVCQLGESLADGDYEVTLLFAEIFFGSGCPGGGGAASRRFDIQLEGATVANDVNIFNLGEGCVSDPADQDAEPVALTYTVSITDGRLDVFLNASVGTALISAIKIRTAR